MQEFDSLADACRFVGKDHTWVTCITNVCNGKRHTSLGYKWKWK